MEVSCKYSSYSCTQGSQSIYTSMYIYIHACIYIYVYIYTDICARVYEVTYMGMLI